MGAGRTVSVPVGGSVAPMSRQERSSDRCFVAPGGGIPHSPVSPTWSCAGCGREWPCPARREELLTEYAGDSLSLLVYLGDKLIAAVADLPQVPAGRLHHRIVGWARSAVVGAGPDRGHSAPSRPFRPAPLPATSTSSGLAG